MKNKSGLVALIVLAIATLLMIFFVLPNVNGTKETAKAPVVDEAKPADTAAADTKSARPQAQPDAGGEQAAAPATTDEAKPADAAPAEAKPAETAAAGAKPADPTAAWIIPGFDVLRVEPDGSTVIAGRAQPNTKLEIVNGTAVVGTADVGANGDFAAVFDKPLAPGDYQLTLRSVGTDGLAKSSEEVATISIPKDKAGELLAMVSKPGEASRIITKPVAETAAANAPAASTPAAGGKPADQTAAAEAAPAETANAAATTTNTKSDISVSAVEIEGRKIFVAGSAKPGSLVRIYADDKLVGEIKADDQGRFVVDGVIDLAVGNHTIRADVVGADGTVAFRAAVPFDRPAGEQVAVVAQQTAAALAAPFDASAFEGLRGQASKALALLKGLFADGKTPGVEELAAARSATEISLKSLADFKVTDNIDQTVRDLMTRTADAAGKALALLKALPQDAASVLAALGKIDAALGTVLTEPVVATAPANAPVTAPAVDAATGAQGEVAAPSASAEPETVRQEPLQQSKNSVIIRRGDTLWQISRRVYGAGVRYTTIYLANEDQIADPDRIVPGQIFGVPDKALPDAESEEIHRKHVQHEREL